MITTKSPREIDLMRKAGHIVALAHKRAKEVIRPGLNTLELDRACEKVILDQGATPSFKGLYGFPNACCISVNEVLVHGIPNKHTVLKEGDIVSVDIGACYKGYHGDSAWSYPVGQISEEAQRLLDVTEESLYKGLEKANAQYRLGDISHAIEEYVIEHGYSVPKDYTGHGIGSDVHEDPSVPNFGKAGSGIRLRAGMCLAIEPMVQAGKPQTKTLSDDWTVVSRDGSLTAHFEHTVVIGEDSCEILTKLQSEED
ncbi:MULTISPECIES: type I methionyl aminopeptidase [unclassified Breznakia]|uniref:type I methionyl aminopeptidase n=1 Tax=unclassified Breznakia TaxID=2623764 RepID=UPI002473CD71|nr:MULTISPECIES: type I methionyl aminopeptidase [unclassified Breznakia]MDH6366145.1 methionyl aminopeptidase [Breznakia sp. PH1-1]MDH6403238.1 methionyl aminopeptidase [Breznakia sp. PF1-11]MDH6410947.1 methionyl aminopeptidase [Breznakia sp. PFB1-11]MDH6413311.1 methionyl aminopeptidase [Breznakia sp. PFB1-14]MDH6416076.1 methionyl aminopeptidase [Breznakia sp. PFB1-4]